MILYARRVRWVALVGVVALAACDGVFGLDPLAELPPADASVPGTWQSIATGEVHLCGIRLDGTLWCSGRNDKGQLGLGPEVPSVEVATQVGTAQWSVLSTRASTTCGIQADSTLWCWGANSKANVGDGSTMDRFTPFQIAGSWQSVAAGAGHTCAIASDGASWCWGDNLQGQVGAGDTVLSHPLPTLVSTPTSLTSLTAGTSHVCGLAADQTAWCWGSGYFGELGNGSFLSASVPTRVSDQVWTAISAGGSHTCAVRSDGHLRCWGDNSLHQLGGDVPMRASSPIKVGLDDTIYVAVSGGGQHTCATTEDGALQCWGSNASGQLGGAVGGFVSRPTEVVGAASTWDVISAGQGNTCAVARDHNLWCMGLGVQNAAAKVLEPTTVMGRWSSIAACQLSTCAIDTSGALYCWGSNAGGQIGDESYVSRSIPTKIAEPSWISVDCGAQQVCAVRSDNALFCWGTSYWSLGDGSQSRVMPTQVASTRAFARVGVGSTHACAVETGTNALYCWGANYFGQLGVGDLMDRKLPAPVDAQQWLWIAGGSYHTCGIGSAGTQCWGYNMYGTIGDGTITNALTPKAVAAASNVWTGANHSCALTGSNATCWGYNYVGQLGDGTTETRLVPTAIAGTWSELSLGASHSCGISLSGGLFCWGENTSGQLGDRSMTSSPIPTQIGTDLTWAHVDLGTFHTCALKTDNSLWCWGDNSAGELGLGTAADSGKPVIVP